MRKQKGADIGRDALITPEQSARIYGGGANTDVAVRSELCPFRQTDISCGACRYVTTENHCALQEQWGN